MKIAVISDIHSNLEALTRVLEEVQRHHVEVIYCLGDIVGYGADAAACVDLVRAHCKAVVRGNHDEAVALNKGVAYLPKYGKEAVLHNREQLSPDQLAYLAGLPLRLESEAVTLVHAAPQEPENWLRLESFLTAQAQFKYFSTDYCFIGHSHTPGIMSDKIGVLRVRPGYRFIINVGSVGQPRDHNPRASFAVFDTEAVSCEILRVPYDVEAAGNKIIEAGLPRWLADRLKKGV